MKKALLFLIILLLFSCKSRKVALNTDKETSQINLAEFSKVHKNSEAELSNSRNVQINATDNKADDSREFFEFEADSVSYNAKTGHLYFKPKGKVKYSKSSKKTQQKQTAVSTNTRSDFKIMTGSDSIGKKTIKNTVKKKNKIKAIESEFKAGHIVLLLLAGLVIFFLIYKRFK